MTTRQVTIPTDILDALDQRLAILSNQINASLQSLRDLEFTINEVRGHLLQAYELSTLLPEERALISEAMEIAHRETELVAGSRERLEKELLPHAESPLETGAGASSAAPPGREGAPDTGPAEPPRKRAPRRRDTPPPPHPPMA